MRWTLTLVVAMGVLAFVPCRSWADQEGCKMEAVILSSTILRENEEFDTANVEALVRLSDIKPTLDSIPEPECLKWEGKKIRIEQALTGKKDLPHFKPGARMSATYLKTGFKLHEWFLQPKESH
ncbi:MAG TPA: hypothetical protein PL182_13665 [Pseudobdellovibrionaceae bacterium]|nr:hypothetical protein [Pseudobdellovibrionaceae bacterium]